MVFSSEPETNPHMTVAIWMYLGSVESLYLCVTSAFNRSCAILSQKVFLFYLLLRLIFAHVVCVCVCIYMTNAFTAAMLNKP